MQIKNVVTTADLKQRIDAPRFLYYRWGRYDLEYYGGRCGYIKDEEIPGRVTIFLTGKMISTGANSIKDSIEQLEHALNILVKEKLARKVRLYPKVQNIVAVMNLNYRLDTKKVTAALPDSSYEPEVFPAIIYKTPHGTTCLMFESGKIVITGARTEQQLRKSENLLTAVIEKTR